MANFDKSFNKLILTEGGYVNDPADRGGETYLGISRVHHPDSLMWPIIDDVKKVYGTKNINTRLKSNSSITKEAKNSRYVLYLLFCYFNILNYNK